MICKISFKAGGQEEGLSEFVKQNISYGGNIVRL